MAKNDICKLRLDSIAAGGDALGRIGGKPVFIEGGAPDEDVLCRITEDHNTWARAELLEIKKPSPARIDAACPFYGKCGGCNLQHIKYEAQIKIKENILKDTLLRIGGISAPEPVIFSSPPWEYRNRMQFHCFRERPSGQKQNSYTILQREEKAAFGLMGRAGEEIVPITDCPIAVPSIRELLRRGASNGVSRGGNGITLPPEKDRFAVFSKDDIFLHEGGQQRGKIKLLDKEITLDAGVFFQSNCLMLEKLILEIRKTAQEAAYSEAGQTLPMADLYCGAGTFALFLGDLFPKVCLAEENKTAVSLARENLRGINADFFALRDTEWGKTIFKEQKTENKDQFAQTGNQKAGAFGFIVVDPPRAGLSPKLAASLTHNGPPFLAYISCDAASLSRDSKILTKGGYKLDKLMLFDFYPQTAHVESLAVFCK